MATQNFFVREPVKRVLLLGPTVCTEYWVSNWDTTWGQPLGKVPDPAAITGNMDHMYYNWNASFNFYIIAGGTNFGFWSGSEDPGNGNEPVMLLKNVC